ncbi:MAG TPA: methyl-accepting chemotaxis protein [Herbaspirillum sp.]
MTITRRLILTLSVALIALLFVGAYGLNQLRLTQVRFSTIQDKIIPSVRGLNNAKGWLAETRLDADRLSIFSNLNNLNALDKALADANHELDASIAAYEKTLVDGDVDRRMLEEDKANIAAYRTALIPFLAAAHSSNMDDVRATLLPDAPLTLAAAKAKNGLDLHVRYNNKLLAETRAENTEAYDFTFKLMIAVIVASLLLTGAMALHLFNIIRSSLNNIQTSLQDVSESLDLTQRAPVERSDEIGRTAVAFNHLLARIVEVLTTVRASTDSVGLASREIAAGNLDLSSRTEQQAASLEETASSMEELTSAVKQNADNARRANVLAVNASTIAEQGNEVVSQVVGTMHGIASSSSKIAEITGVIESIAFQTNILALNAAVEAARAGEEGRGFAVVATEVRNLAQRSSNAAKEIKELIADSVRQVASGSSLVETAGQTMQEITGAVKQVTDIISEISVASEEQRHGIEQINQAITQMDSVTQQNAALVEQAAAAAQSLEDQGRRLSDAVAIFHLGEVIQASTQAVISAVRRPVLAASRLRTIHGESNQRLLTNGLG